MADIFISYAHEDQDFVRRMVPALEAEGFSVWWDHTIPPGHSWDSFIARGIKEAKAAIVVWSTVSVESDWVKEEATVARAGGKYLPVQVTSADPPMGFSRIQAANLTNWNGDRADPHWQLLVREAHARVSGSSGPGPEPMGGPQTLVRPMVSPLPLQQTASPAKGPNMAVVGLIVAAVLVVGAGAWWAGSQNKPYVAPPSATEASTYGQQSATQSTLPQQTTAPIDDGKDASQAEIDRLKREAEAAEAARKDAESLAAAERSKREAIERAQDSARADTSYSSVARAPIPASFSIGAAEDALGGNTKRLTNSFVFSETPQGHAYWWAIYEKGGPMPPEAAAQLRDWVRRYKAGEKPGTK